MKRIGILTLSASDNCGSLLQTFALQQVLIKICNCEVEIINLVTEQSKKVYSLFSKDFYKHPKKTFFTLKNIKSIIKQKQGYQSFRDDYLKLTDKVYSSADDIQDIVDSYDVIITGSDQVWNVYMSDYSDAFYLPWNTRASKVAYATSLGATVEIDKDKSRELTRWLSDFTYISVREKSGKKTIEKLTDKEIFITADPTLLLSKKEWGEMIKEPLIDGKYIFYYSWSYPNEEMNRIVQEFAKKKKLNVYVINSSKWYKYRPDKYDFILCEESGPLVFLNLMKYAEYVFVQSFHGTVFANIFEKNFFFLNENENVDFRTKNLLEIFHEEERAIHQYSDIHKIVNSELTYKSNELDELIDESMRFLKEAVTN
ncbi:polysaccharide pyruvyl transferase family protein [Agathobacter sp. LCP21S3_B2]|uniref:polysaccharide pyruvyl transferase family protein n=1 Tax=Agathobacter sp. LCP21S3_B2 TaxID=3438734 RepID=UPI003F904268